MRLAASAQIVQPDQLRVLLKYLEPAVDACLLAGQDLPPFPLSARGVAAAPTGAARARSASSPALTIRVVGMPKTAGCIWHGRLEI